MAPKKHISDILRKETVRILLKRFQSDMLGKLDDFPDEDVVCEDIEEQLDNAYVNRKGVPLAMDIFKPKVDEYTELPVIVVSHGGGLVAVSYLDETTAPLSYDVVWWKKLIRIVLGVGLALVLKEAIKLLNVFDVMQISLCIDAIRYFIVVMTVGYLCPLLFKKINL